MKMQYVLGSCNLTSAVREYFLLVLVKSGWYLFHYHFNSLLWTAFFTHIYLKKTIFVLLHGLVKPTQYEVVDLKCLLFTTENIYFQVLHEVLYRRTHAYITCTHARIHAHNCDEISPSQKVLQRDKEIHSRLKTKNIDFYKCVQLMLWFVQTIWVKCVLLSVSAYSVSKYVFLKQSLHSKI